MNNMRYASIRKMDVSNGKGLGISLFVQGCHFHCKGCFNQETWDFDGGKEWNEEIEAKFLSLLDRPYIVRVSILGGEPFEERNLEALNLLIAKCFRKRPDITIWVYTGYKFETLLDKGYAKERLLGDIDYLVDGQFELDKQDLNYSFAGSRNQRVIDVQKSMASNKVVLAKL